MNRFFHSELDSLKSKLMLMGDKSSEALGKSMQALSEFEVDLALEVIDGDDVIDQLEIDIDHEATRYLTLRAPVASDLRLLTVAIKASHDLERVGDEARTIAKRARKIIVKSGVKRPLLHIGAMSGMAADMVHDALQSFLREDPDLAKAVLEKDEEVDRLNKANYKEFIRQAKSNPADIDDYIDLIFISKSLERIADHATNLAEEVIFLTTGHEMRHQH